MTGRVFRSFAVGPFVIVPQGETAGIIPGFPIVLGKKGAFGSGEHETTIACLEELSRLPALVDATVLDLGSGTGILSVAAAHLGAKQVIALDNDWRAALSCFENIRLNVLGAEIVTVCGELSCLSGSAFDLVLANIYADIHLALAGELCARTLPGGFLVLSGIPLQDKFDVQTAYLRSGCELVDSRIGEDYATFVMRRI